MRLSKEIHAQLRAQFNPDGSELRKAQLRMLDLLLWVDSVCKKNNIPYCLESGTLLGAVRHGGFIPWDDDIDVSIPIKHYKRAKKAFLSENHPQFVIQCPETDKYAFKFWLVARDRNSRYNHSNIYNQRTEKLKKYRGLQVDLFPIDNRVNKNLNVLLFNPGYYLAERIVGKFGTSPLIRETARFFFWLQYYTAKCFRFLTPRQKYWTYAYGIGFKSTRIEEDLYPFSEIEFEGHKFPAPHNPDAYLSRVFGDYMKLPPIEQLTGHQLLGIDIW